MFVSVIAPFGETRKLISEMIDPVWIYIKRDLPVAKDRPYEVPKQPHVIVDVDKLSVAKNIQLILKELKKIK